MEHFIMLFEHFRAYRLADPGAFTALSVLQSQKKRAGLVFFQTDYGAGWLISFRFRWNSLHRDKYISEGNFHRGRNYVAEKFFYLLLLLRSLIGFYGYFFFLLRKLNEIVRYNVSASENDRKSLLLKMQITFTRFVM